MCFLLKVRAAALQDPQNVLDMQKVLGMQGLQNAENLPGAPKRLKHYPGHNYLENLFSISNKER